MFSIGYSTKKIDIDDFTLRKKTEVLIKPSTIPLVILRWGNRLIIRLASSIELGSSSQSLEFYVGITGQMPIGK